MTSFPVDLVPLLRPAIEAGRTALRELDHKEIPAILHRVAATTGGKLPPPLARSLLEQLDGDEWLRSKAIEAWQGLDPDSAVPATRISSLFLTRPDGWWRDLAQATAELRAADLAARMERLETAVASAREEASEARRRERETRSELERGDRQARSETAALRAQLGSGREDERRAAERREGRIASFEATIGELRRELDEAEHTVAAFREQVQQARRERAAALRVAGAAGSRSMPRDPIEMGRFLDEVAAAARRFGGDTELAAGTPAEFRLPAGVAPDRREAVEWLVRQPVPFALIVDGYNVTFQIGAGSGSGARRRLSAALGRMRRAAASASRVILVFDSAAEPAGSVAAGPGGIEVRFSSEGRSADEEIVALAGELGGAVVVISSDREVRDRAEHHGALCLWGEALAEWLRDRA